MKRITQLIAASICMLSVSFAYAQQNDTSGDSSCAPPCPPKPCAPAPCPKPCPPKPCKPCPPVCFERGYPDTNCCIPSAYNEPADYEISPCPWDFWIDASFTYWLAYQEGLDIAQSAADFPTGNSVFNNSVFFIQDTEWKPGFKIGLGLDLDHDHWSGFAEYTWFRSRTATSTGRPPIPAGASDAVWVFNDWDLGQEDLTNSLTPEASAIDSVWRLRMDILDAALTRPYYQGTHLIVAPFGGLRATWIRQNLRIASTPFATTPADATSSAVFHNKSYAWAVGPRGGFQGEWHLGWGFRIEGDVAGSIAFTRYTRVASRADSLFSAVPEQSSSSYTNYNTIRFNNDMNIGIGWGDYFDCRNYHFDLLLTYDFQIFWNQNMMRQQADATTAGVGSSASNLYLQGLTVRTQFDF